MKTEDEIESANRQNSNILIIIVSFLLLASIALSVIGLFNEKKIDLKKDNDIIQGARQVQKQDDEESLSDIFQKEFSREPDVSGYDPGDPFKEICAPARGGYAPSTSSFTVCQP